MGFTRTTQETRVPPQDLGAERAALSAMLQGTEASREAIAKAASTLQVDHFYRAAHQDIYRAVRELFEAGEKVDLVTVCDQLKRAGRLDNAGGQAYVAGLVDEIAIAENIEQYGTIVKDKATMRKLSEVGYQIFDRAARDQMRPEELMNQASQYLYTLAQERLDAGLQRIEKLIVSEIEKVESIQNQAAGEEAMMTGLPTGFHWLDQLTSGLQKGELIVVAARPGMGKTSFALNIAEHASRVRKIPVLVFSLEMSSHALVRRMICSQARVDSHDVRRGRLFAEDRARLMHAASVLHDLPIWIDESSWLMPIQVRARARRVFGETSAFDGLIIVDYLQLMDFSNEGGGGRPESRQQEITAISRSMKSVAKELNVPVMVLSQLSRAPERRDISKPRLSDLRESGAIEQDADVVVFIYRDSKDTPEGAEGMSAQQPYVARVCVAKQRNGPTGTFRLIFNRAYTRFDNPAEIDELMPEDE
jgi:replicative DNA helicase